MKTKFLTWLIAILFLCGISAFAQPTSGIYLPQTVTSYGSHFARAVVDSAFGFPTGNGAPSTLQSSYRGLAMFRYDSTAGQLYIYNPKSSVMAWSVVSGGGTTVVSDSAWSLDGNANASGKFLGTTTAQDLIIKANNTELIRLLSTGGIRLPATIDSTTGVIFKGSDRFIHSYQNPATRTDLGQSLYIGRKSGNFNFTGASGGYGGRNTAIGDSTLFANTTGYRNVAIGIWNSNSNTTGFENTSVGANAFEKNIDGYDNTAIGAISLKANTSGWRNTAVGFSTLQVNTTGARNTALGGRASFSNSSGFANVSVGFDALYWNTIGDHNVGVGLDALYYSDGTHNTAIGDSTLWGLYPTYGWSANQKHMGYKNTAIGSRAGYHKGDSIFNYASIFDTAATFLGANASRDSSIPYTTSLQNMTVIGYNARGFASNQVVLGNDDVTTTLLKGAVGIGTRTPDASSIFDGVSTTKGVLLPRMNTTQQNAISSPAVGLIIFNTDTADYMVYKVSSWVRIGGAGSGGGTWEDALTAGSTLTTDHQVSHSNNFFVMSGVANNKRTWFTIEPNDSLFTMEVRSLSNATLAGISVSGSDTSVNLTSLSNKIRISSTHSASNPAELMLVKDTITNIVSHRAIPSGVGMVYPGAGIALSTGSAWGTSITDNSANWNTAFGWGNHASAGYITSSSVSTLTNKDLTSGTNTFPTFNQNTTGSAATLTTTRTIWGQNFNGSANVTGLLALGANDLTMTGSLAATGARVTKGWFTDIESTNMLTVGGTSLNSIFQASDADLTAIAALSPTNDDIIQRKAGAWTNRTMAQVKTDLVLVKGDVGLGNVDNTSDATKNSATSTLSNKRWTARVGSTTSSATPTINTDNYDIYKLTAQAANITSFTTNLTGTPVDGDILEIQITGTAARTIAWGTSFVSSTVTLPATTVTTATLTVILQYYTTSSYGTNKWVCVNSF